jgi:transposase
MKKLREMIFGKRTERHQARKTEGREKVDESEKSDDGQLKAPGDQDARAELRTIGSVDKPKRKGHGRRAASDYSGAKIVRCRHERLKAGKEPTALMQFTGQPLITATKFEREALRCAKCQQRYVAPLPEGVKEERYEATCDATIALMRYGGGLPWHRQAGLLLCLWRRRWPVTCQRQAAKLDTRIAIHHE